MERDEELEKEIALYIKNLKREFWNELPALGEEGLASIARHFAQWQKERDESDDELYAIHLEKWDITGECPSELEAKIDAKFGITGRDSNGNPSNGYCDWKKDIFTNGASIYSFVKLGMDYQKEQMMKDAEQIRFDCSLPCKTFNNLKAKGVEIGDKLFIIKE